MTTRDRELRQKKLTVKWQVSFVLWALVFLGLSLLSQSQNPANGTVPLSTTTFRTTTTLSTTTSRGPTPTTPEFFNCTPPSIDDFPPDLFTPAQRRSGYLAVHFVASLYIFYALALVCDEYFVPSIESICEGMSLPSDVAGATFMAIATSSPELFTNIIGTFVTKGDLGVGTIVGSAVFNILAVAAVCGLAAHTALPLEWYPLTRDCLFYSISVILLILVLNNRRVYWYEAAVLILVYVIYITVMYFNTAIRGKAEGFVNSFKKKDVKTGRTRRASFVAELTASTERSPLLGGKSKSDPLSTSMEIEDDDGDITAETLDELLIAKALHNTQDYHEKEEWRLFRLPSDGGLWTMLLWVITWPARFVLAFTVPDCREPTWRRFYLLTFLMCIVWIALLSYLVSWMMTVIGHTLGIPDSVMGLTFIAAGTSVPEAVSSIIVARQGLGTMSISNSIGSNTFDILICLGLPWLIRSSLLASAPDGENFIQINSAGLEYSAIMLMASLVILYLLLATNGFYLNKRVSVLALSMYAIFLVMGSLMELNVFFTVNLPTCPIIES